MYLEYVKVNNFGVHKVAEAVYRDGFVVVTGDNGIGKSSLCIQAPLYAMFGAGTLAATIDDTVTSGEKAGTLKVEAKYGPYVVVRSKSSAAVTGNDIKISGQEQVSEFFRELFGVTKKAETKILVAEQKKVSGILSGKGAEVNSFIESIAGFSQIDDLVERVQDKFPSGNKKFLEEHLDILTATGVNISEEKLDEIKPLEEVLKQSTTNADTQGLSVSGAKGTLAGTRLKLTEATKINSEIELITKEISLKEASVEEETLKIEELQTDINNIIYQDAGDIIVAQKFLDTMDEITMKFEAQEVIHEFKQLEDVWDGDEEEFKEELSGVSANVRDYSKRVEDNNKAIHTLKAQLVTDTKCKTCGTDLSDRYEEINIKLQEDIEEASILNEKIMTGLAKAQEEISVFNNINTEHIRRKRAVEKLAYTKVNINTDTVPFTYTLDYAPVIKPDSTQVTAYTRIINDQSEALKAKKRLASEVTTVHNKINSTGMEIAAKCHARDNLGVRVETSTLEATVLEQEEALKNMESTLSDITTSNNLLSISLAELRIKHTDKESRTKENEENIKKTRKKIVTDIRNGKMLSNIRSAKTTVLRAVWDKILIPVGARYSTMVGTTTKVVRTDRGFRVSDAVNGDRAVTRLSGSEETILGVALRATLKDVFAPSCGFMAWDEPLDGAGPDRALAIIAAIRSLPGQNIMVTHDSDSQITCDQLIEIGD